MGTLRCTHIFSPPSCTLEYGGGPAFTTLKEFELPMDIFA